MDVTKRALGSREADTNAARGWERIDDDIVYQDHGVSTWFDRSHHAYYSFSHAKLLLQSSARIQPCIIPGDNYSRDRLLSYSPLAIFVIGIHCHR